MAEKIGMRCFHPLRFALVLAVVWLVPFAFAADPDLSTNENRLAFVEALLEKYPNIVRANLQFRRNLMEVLKQFHELSTQLGPNMTPMSGRELSTLELTYSPNGQLGPNLEAIKNLRERFQNDLEQLPLTELKGFAGDLQALPELSSRDGKFDAELFKKNVSRLIRQAPMLYDAKGHPIVASSEWKKSAKQRLADARASELESLYSDMFTQHQLPLLEAAVKQDEKRAGMLGQTLRVQASGLKRDVTAAARPIMTNGAEGAARYLRLEEVLSPVDIFRGCFGKDCSILSVPFFPAVKGTKTYFVHKSKAPGAQPEGYLFVAPVEVNGKTLPYVITANGNLTELDVRKALQSVALDWGVDEYVHVDFAKAPHVVNSSAMTTGLKAPHSKKIKVALPPGWSEVSKYIETHSTGYNNYYASANLQDAYVAKIEVESPDLLDPIKRTLAPSKPLMSNGTIQALPAFDRAVLAAGVTYGDRAGEQGQFVMERLKVTPGQVKVAEKLVGNEEIAMSKETFAGLHQEFGFRFRDLETLDLAKWMLSLNRLHREEKSIAPDAEWARSYERVWADILKSWEQAADPDRGQLLTKLNYFLSEVPNDYRPMGKPFIDSVLAWAASSDRLPHLNMMGLLTQGYISPKQLQGIFPRLATLVPHMDDNTLEFFTRHFTELSKSWTPAEQEAAWKSWYQAATGRRTGLFTILRQVPEEFRGLDWHQTMIKHSDYGAAVIHFLRLKQDLASRPMSAEEKSAIQRIETVLLQDTVLHLNNGKHGLTGYTLDAALNFISQPEYRTEVTAKMGEEALKKRLFYWVYTDSNSSFQSFAKYRALQKLGWLEEYLGEHGFNGGWYRGSKGSDFSGELAKLLKDPEVPESTRALARRKFLAESSKRYDSFISSYRGEFSFGVIYARELENPYLPELVGPAEYDAILERLRRDALTGYPRMGFHDRDKLAFELKRLAEHGPPQPAAAAFDVMDKLGMLKKGQQTREAFQARLQQDPEVAAQYQRLKKFGFGKVVSRTGDSCSRLFQRIKSIADYPY